MSKQISEQKSGQTNQWTNKRKIGLMSEQPNKPIREKQMNYWTRKDFFS